MESASSISGLVYGWVLRARPVLSYGKREKGT